jgi:hypothetical protein
MKIAEEVREWIRRRLRRRRVRFLRAGLRSHSASAAAPTACWKSLRGGRIGALHYGQHRDHADH